MLFESHRSFTPEDCQFQLQFTRLPANFEGLTQYGEISTDVTLGAITVCCVTFCVRE